MGGVKITFYIFGDINFQIPEYTIADKYKAVFLL